MSSSLSDPSTPHPAGPATENVSGAPAIRADGLTLKGPRGPVFGPLDLTLARSGFALLVGQRGSGRTSALLCLIGRMKPSGGTLEVLGEPLPKRASKIQARTALATSSGLDDIDESLTVRELFAERQHLLFPPHRRGRLDAGRIAELCSPAFGTLDPPEPKTMVWDLDRPHRVALQIALALVGDPELLVVDDLDQLEVSDRVDLFGGLQRLAAGGIAVVAATTADVLPGDPGVQQVALHPGALDADGAADSSASREAPTPTPPSAADQPHPRHAADDETSHLRTTSTGKEL